jgi:hypothetical protein
MSVRITGVRKDHGNHYNPHEAVSHYRWVEDGTGNTNIAPRQPMVEWIENGGTAYVSDGQRIAWCGVQKNQNGTKYLRTHSDGHWSDNLLNLPEC